MQMLRHLESRISIVTSAPPCLAGLDIRSFYMQDMQQKYHDTVYIDFFLSLAFSAYREIFLYYFRIY